MTELTASLIVDSSRPQDLQLSPDGTHVAYTLVPLSKAQEHATSTIWIAPTDGSATPRQFTHGDVLDKQPKWSPDGTQLAFLSDRAKRGIAQLYLIPANGGEAKALTSESHKKSVESFAWSPTGDQIAFTSADEPNDEDERREKERDDARVSGERLPYARLRLLSLATCEVTTLIDRDCHIADFVWNPQGTEIAYLVRQTPELESIAYEHILERVTLANRESHEVCRLPIAISDLTWSHDGKTLLFICSIAMRSQSSQAVYAVPAQGGKPRHLACGETNCAGTLIGLQEKDKVAVLIGEGLTSWIARLDISTGTTTTLFPSLPTDQSADYRDWHVRILKNGKTALASVQGAYNQPWEVWFSVAGDTSPPRKLSNHQTQLADITFASQEPFHWTAPDGLALDGLLLRPPGAPKNQPLPTIVLVHGGPYSRSSHGFLVSWGQWAQWLALAGYAILLPNYRGGMGHGESFAVAAQGGVGMGDFTDIMSGVDAAIERGIADPTRLGIGGWSQGGFLSAWAITQTDRFKAAIMGAGVSDWGMMVMSSDLPDFERELGGSAPWDGVGPHQHLKLSPISFAQNVKTPVLILHGENDARVPLSQATGFYRALRGNGLSTEFVVYPREPHGIGERSHQLDVLRRVRDWYDRWLK